MIIVIIVSTIEKKMDIGAVVDMLSVLFLVVLGAALLLARRRFRERKKGTAVAPAQARFVYGPPAYPVVGSLPSVWKNKERLLEWYTDMLRSSPTQTIVLRRAGGARTIVTANPANVEHMLKTRFENYPKGRQFTFILGDLLGNGIFNADGDAWMLQRKLASFQFSTKSLRSFISDVVIQGTQDLVCVLDSRRNQVLDLQNVLQRFTFDGICKVAFGVDMATLRVSLPESSISTAFDIATELSAARDAMPLQWTWKLKKFLNLGSERRLAEAIRAVHTFADDIIRRRRTENRSSSSSSDGDDLLSRFMAAESRSDDDVFVRDMIVSFILAGRDSTSAALTWFFWLLFLHPSEEERVRAEILREYSGAATEYSRMPYLHAALCEAMRLYPPVPVDSKHAAAPDVLPDGTGVHSGDRVTFHPFAMGRLDALWGANATAFRPERWLGADGNPVSVSPFLFAVFQAGARVCLGKEMAFLQMKHVAAAVLRRFSVRPAETGFRPRLVHCLTSRMYGGFPVVVSRIDEKEGDPPAESNLPPTV